MRHTNLTRRGMGIVHFELRLDELAPLEQLIVSALEARGTDPPTEDPSPLRVHVHEQITQYSLPSDGKASAPASRPTPCRSWLPAASSERRGPRAACRVPAARSFGRPRPSR